MLQVHVKQLELWNAATSAWVDHVRLAASVVLFVVSQVIAVMILTSPALSLVSSLFKLVHVVFNLRLL